MITDSKKWHYLAVKNLSVLLRGVTSNHNRDFYCLNCFHSYRTENKLRKHEKVCNDHDFCYVEIPNEEKSYTEKKLSICLLDTQYLQVVRLTQQKTNLILTKVKIVWKVFAKT